MVVLSTKQQNQLVDEFFNDLVDRDVFIPGNILHVECLWFCFAGILQNYLDKVKDHWNTHYIRGSRNGIIKGRADELYFLPEEHGGIDDLIQGVPAEQFEYLSEHLVFNEVENEYEEYLILNSELQMPVDWMDALDLYNTRPSQEWRAIVRARLGTRLAPQEVRFIARFD